METLHTSSVLVETVTGTWSPPEGRARPFAPESWDSGFGVGDVGARASRL